MQSLSGAREDNKKWAWLIKSGRGRKIFRALRAQLYLQPHHTKNPRSAPEQVCLRSLLKQVQRRFS